MKKAEFIAMVKRWGRKEMLKLTRRWGFTAHKMDDDNLAKFLWKLKQKHHKGAYSCRNTAHSVK